MRTRIISTLGVFALLVLTAGIASAAVETLPDTSSTVTFTATVAEQCDVVALPAAVAFDVQDTSSSTTAANATVTINGIAVADTNKLRIELQANSANFTPPGGAGTTWAAGDVSWDDGTAWTNGTGNGAALSNGGFTEVVTSDANANTLSCASLVFTLAAKATVNKAGNHTLVATWKLSSVP